MRTVLLDEKAFDRSFAAPMREVPADPEPAVDVWPYVFAIPATDLGAVAYRAGEVDHVYRSGDDRFDHVLIPTAVRNIYLVVVVARASQAIYGHHLLDLNRKYGLGDPAEECSSPEATALCAARGVAPVPPHNSSKLGIALATLDRDPLNGMRLPPEGGACGWYIWGGEMSDLAKQESHSPTHAASFKDSCVSMGTWLRA